MRSARPMHARFAHSGRADEIHLRHHHAARVLLAEQDHPGHQEIQVRRAERAGQRTELAGYAPVPTRLMFPCPSICPPPRKNASILPSAARSNSSTPPLVKKLFFSEPSTVTRISPPDSERASSAPAPGIGEAAPTATWRQPCSRRAITATSSSVAE